MRCNRFFVGLAVGGMGMASLALTSALVDAAVVTTDLSIHYRADNVDGLGNPGNALTTALVNLASPGTHNGTIVGGSGVSQNIAQIGTPYEYGIPLTGASQTHIQANSYQVGGGVNKVTDATWEYWLRADSAQTVGRGALYGEFASGTTNQTRHFLRLEGIGTATRRITMDEYPPSGNSAASDPQLFQTGEFTQIVATKSGDTMTFYKDGIQLGSAKTHSETFSGSAAQTLFGKRNSQNESFDGQFNVIRVYDSALTSLEVLGNYNAEVGLAPPPIPSYTDVDFSDAVAAGDLVPNNPSGPHTLTVDDPDAGSFTVTISGTGATHYDSGRGGGFRNSSGYADSSQTWSFTISGLDPLYEVTDFGIGYVEADLGTGGNTTSTLTIDAGGPTLATFLHVDSPSPDSQWSNDMFGTPVGNYGNAPTFNVGIDDDFDGSADIVQFNGLAITVTQIPEPSTFLMLALALLGLGCSRRRRSRRG